MEHELTYKVVNKWQPRALSDDRVCKLMTFKNTFKKGMESPPLAAENGNGVGFL